MVKEEIMNTIFSTLSKFLVDLNVKDEVNVDVLWSFTHFPSSVLLKLSELHSNFAPSLISPFLDS